MRQHHAATAADPAPRASASRNPRSSPWNRVSAAATATTATRCEPAAALEDLEGPRWVVVLAAPTTPTRVSHKPSRGPKGARSYSWARLRRAPRPLRSAPRRGLCALVNSSACANVTRISGAVAFVRCITLQTLIHARETGRELQAFPIQVARRPRVAARGGRSPRTYKGGPCAGRCL